MKYIDVYGQPIQFKYKNSSVYPTTCGLVVSFIVVVLIILYIVLYSIDVAKMDTPVVLNIPENLNPSPKYTFYPDDGIIFSEVAAKPDLMSNSNSEGYLQLMFGLRNRHTNKWVSLDETNLIAEVKNNDKDLFFDSCHGRVAYLKNNIFLEYELSNAYCIYGDINLQGDLFDKDYSSLTISIKVADIDFEKDGSSKCERKTYRNTPLFMELYNKYLPSDYNYLDQIYKKCVNYGSKTEIDSKKDELFYNYDFYFLYVNSLFNQTKFNDPISYYLDWKTIEIGKGLMSSVSAYFQKNKLTTFTKIIPKSLTSSNVSEYYVSFDEDKYSNIPRTMSNELIRVTVKSSDRVNQYERTYTTIFDILGKIGGLSKIIILIGGFFAFYSSSTRLKESLINDFYSVIDPENSDKINKKFEDFLQEIQNNKEDIKNSLKEKNKLIKNVDISTKKEKELYLKGFFLAKLDHLLEIQQNLEKGNNLVDKAEYSIAKIVYGLYLKIIYSGLHYSTFEMLENLCWSCCPCCSFRLIKGLRRKNIIFEKAVKALHRDTDFVSILERVQNFESIKAIFLKKETQFALFKSLANKPFASFLKTPSSSLKSKKSSKSNDFDSKSEEKRLKEEKEEKEDNFSENNPHFLENLYRNLLAIVKGEKSKEEFELDKSLVDNLVDDNSTEGEKLMKIIQNLIAQTKSEMEKKKNFYQRTKKILLDKNDLEKINKHFE